jgi:hypothetical protein
MSNHFNIEDVFTRFDIPGTFAGAEPYGSGHINDTLLVTTAEADQPDYIFQRVNHRIFKDVPGLMENIARVTEHVRFKLLAEGANADRETLTLIKTRDGAWFDKTVEGDFWRAYLFIDKTVSYDIVKSPELANEGGKAFGRFQYFLDDLPGGPLNETIVDFHNIASRLQLFHDALDKDVKGRAKDITEELAFIEKNADVMHKVLRLGESGAIPVRVTHNDTKFNNVLFNEHEKALSVVDLDTVMPGYIHYDFADTIRTATNTGEEDEKDVSKVSMDIKLFEAFARGFLTKVGSRLNQAEIDSLAESAQLLPYMIGIRFITDYLDGDNYFKIHHEHHNLQRARAQFALAKSIMSQMDAMKAIVTDIMASR